MDPRTSDLLNLPAAQIHAVEQAQVQVKSFVQNTLLGPVTAEAAALHPSKIDFDDPLASIDLNAVLKSDVAMGETFMARFFETQMFSVYMQRELRACKLRAVTSTSAETALTGSL